MAEGARFLPAEIGEASYAGITTEGYLIAGAFSQPVREVLVQNLTDKILMFSWDGTNNHFVLPSCSSYTVDVGTNKGTSQTSSIPIGFGIYVKAIDEVPTTGSVYVSYFYLS